ncbi:MAG: glycosyltransferase [Hylemonella sp.]
MSAERRFADDFAVLMAVYQRDDPALFDRALGSVFANTLQPAAVWVVADGPLTPALEVVLQKWQQLHSGQLQIERLPLNQGLAHALNAGLQRISQSWVVRADADDLNLPHRFEALARLLQRQPALDVVGSAVQEMTADGRLLGVRTVPLQADEIRRYARLRNPFNHMTVAYRRAPVLAVGGYPPLYLREDYGLWCRLLAAGARMANTDEILVYATAGAGLYRRRGGWRYARAEWALQRLLVTCGLKSRWRAWRDGLLRAAVFLLPAGMRGWIYERMLRRRAAPMADSGS